MATLAGVDEDQIIQYITVTFEGVDVLRPTDGPGANDTFFYYDPERNRDPQRSLPFATIVTKDYGEYDNKSKLDRPGAYRLNIGVSRQTFRTLFPSDGDTSTIDYAAFDTLLPHPLYAAQSFVSVLNPTAQTFDRTIKPLLAEAYVMVESRHAPRT